MLQAQLTSSTKFLHSRNVGLSAMDLRFVLVVLITILGCLFGVNYRFTLATIIFP